MKRMRERDVTEGTTEGETIMPAQNKQTKNKLTCAIRCLEKRGEINILGKGRVK